MDDEREMERADAEQTRKRRWTLVGAALALSLVFLTYLLMTLPVGIAGEWWIEYRTRFASFGAVLLFALCAGAFVGGAALLERAKSAGLRMRVLPLAALVVLYVAFLFSGARCGPAGSFEFVAPAFKWDAAGLFRLEASRIEDAREYLGGFPERLADYHQPERYSDTVRVNNNPPGTTMVFYAARRLAEGAPWLGRLASEAIFGAGFEPPDEEFAGTVLGCWMLLFAGALSLVPAVLVARHLGSTPGFLPAAVALTAGSMVLFVPGKDTLQVFFFLWMVYFFLCGRRGRGWPGGAALGVAAAVAFFFTLATAVVVLVLFLAATWLDFDEGGRSWRRGIAFWAGAAGGLLAGFVALGVLTGYNSLASLVACYKGHTLFYEHFARTYWKWLVFNPFEFAMFFGGPLVVVVAFHLARGLRGKSLLRPGVARALVLSAIFVLVLLDISGKNASEVARLWVFFMPLLALPAAVFEARRVGGFRNLVILGTMQALYVIMLRVYLDVWRVEALMQELSPM